MEFDFSKIEARKSKLANGIEVFSYDNPAMDLVRVELVFDAGAYFQTKPMVALACCSLLTEGSAHHTAEEISERLDYLGAYVEKNADRDQASVVIYGLSRYIPEILSICEDFIKHPLFPERELELYLAKSRQRFAINQQRVNEVSRRVFFSELFGKDHPYGRVLEEEDFDKLHREDLVEFHHRYYTSANCKIVLAGGIREDIRQSIENCFGKSDWASRQIVRHRKEAVPPLQNLEWVKVDMPQSLQASLRIGKCCPSIHDSDFMDFKILDYIFGGYFGSRIMKNIREEKGYTYGISSSLINLRHQSVWMISSEVRAGCWKEVAREISKEMEKLKRFKVSHSELDLVRNCYKGDFLREMDGVFDISERCKFHILQNITSDFYREFFEELDSVTPLKIQQAAQKFFDDKTFSYVVVGR